MTQESYVTFEQAKELKELGFPQPFIYNKELNYYVTRNTIEQIENNEDYIGSVVSDRDNEDGWSTERFKARGYILCPTLSLVQKWLREEKDIHICVDIRDATKWYYVLCSIKNKTTEYINDLEYETYEQALSAGIDKCIELLKEQ